MTAHRPGARRRAAPRRSCAVALGLAAALLVPVLALAHPLGNFTINHYAGVRLTDDGVSLDVVIDRAEIPTFQERQRIDADGDGSVGPAEAEAARSVACGQLASSLHLDVGGSPRALTTVAAGLSYPAGVGGLLTMRLVCEYESTGAPISIGTPIVFRDESFPERIGWREIVLVIPGASDQGAGITQRLTSYPADLLAAPPDVRSVAMVASASERHLTPWSAPDAQPLAGDPSTSAGSSGSRGAQAVPAGSPGIQPPEGLGSIIGGLEADLSSIIGSGELTPLAILASLLVAVGLGAVHALSPGHGKAIMAAYLVGRRGGVRHAVGLGLSVAISHTIGVAALAAITLLAADVLPPERLYPILGVVSGSLVAIIGGSLLLARLRSWAHARAPHRARHGHPTAHEPAPAPKPAASHQHADGSERPAGLGRSTDDVVYYADGTHSHGGGRPHRHLPDASSGLSWRAMFALGLSGGLVPSASALILLLGSIATGRVAYGLVLVLGFGVGMAIVLGGVGLLVVKASSLLERVPSPARLARLSAAIQTGTAVLVVALGVTLAGQALTQVL